MKFTSANNAGQALVKAIDQILPLDSYKGQTVVPVFLPSIRGLHCVNARGKHDSLHFFAEKMRDGCFLIIDLEHQELWSTGGKTWVIETSLFYQTGIPFQVSLYEKLISWGPEFWRKEHHF